MCLSKDIHQSSVSSKVYFTPLFRTLCGPPAAVGMKITLLQGLVLPCKCWLLPASPQTTAPFSLYSSHTGHFPGSICQALFHLRLCTWHIICLNCFSLKLVTWLAPSHFPSTPSTVTSWDYIHPDYTLNGFPQLLILFPSLHKVYILHST